LDEAISVLEECLAPQGYFLIQTIQALEQALFNLGGTYKERNDIKKATDMWRECLSLFFFNSPSSLK
jgi:hypothetical protein